MPATLRPPTDTSWLRRFHQGSVTVCGSGRFEIRRGSSFPAVLLAGILRLPRHGIAVPVRVRVVRAAGADVWIRTFGGRRLVSRQLRRGPVVLEHVGPVELRLAVTVTEDRIEYAPAGAALRLGDRRIPLPGWAYPPITAVARSAAAGAAGPARERFHVRVAITTPRGNPVLRYWGHLEEEA